MIAEHYERVDASLNPIERLPHEARYRMAAGWLRPDDIVLDAACGTGYGAPILEERGPITYLGVERDLSVLEVEPTDSRRFLSADLERWGGPPTPFDVAVVFETLEHVRDLDALVAWTFRARRCVLISVPIMPSVGGNPYHVHDFRSGDIEHLWKQMKPLAHFEQPDQGTGLWVYGQW